MDAKSKLLSAWPVLVVFGLTFWAMFSGSKEAAIALSAAAVGYHFGWLTGETKARTGTGLFAPTTGGER